MGKSLMHLMKQGTPVWLEYTGSEETRYKRERQKTHKSGFYMPMERNTDFILNAMEDSHFWPQQNSLAQAYPPLRTSVKAGENTERK